MSDAPFYSRRLTNKELDAWIKLGEQESIASSFDADDRERSQAFLDLEDSMFFVSYLGDDVIGGSSIYKDTTRNAMALLAVRIQSEHRDRVGSHIVKSSLPFFRTVAIREVDAMLSNENDEGKIPFPLQTEMPSWASKALEENGFIKESDIQNLTFAISESKPKNGITWDSSVASHESIRKLFWSIYEDDRPDYSHLFLGINLSRRTKSLYSSSKNERCEIVLATQAYRQQLLIPTLLYQNASVVSEIPAAIAELCSKQNLSSMSIYVIEEKNQQLIEELVKYFGEPIKRRSLSLMRKKL